MPPPEEKKDVAPIAAKAKDAAAKPKDKDDPDMAIKKEELSEEDKRIREEVELLFTRAQDRDYQLANVAVNTLSEMLRTASGTVASIPKPLKYVRPHFVALRAFAESLPESAPHRKSLFDVLALIAMTLELPEKNAVINIKLRGNHEDVGKWGHEFLRHLAGGISTLWSERKEREESVDDLASLVHQTVSFFMTHADEAAAIDLAMELDETEKILDYTDDSNYANVVDYLMKVSSYSPPPEDDEILEVAFKACIKHNGYPQALRIALATNDKNRVRAAFEGCTDPVVKKQLALYCAAARYLYTTGDDELDEIIGNNKLSEWFRHAARDLDSMAPKAPEDVYKEHLMEKASVPNTANSHMHNLATMYVNAFANAGFGTDKLIDDEGSNWIYRTKDHRMMSAAASVGLIHLWDVDNGLPAVDKYSYAEDNYIKAGALLATGIVLTGVRSPFDPAFGLLSEHVNGVNREMRIGAILGLGFAYAGSGNSDVQDVLVPLIADNSQPIEIQAMAAYALSLIHCGSCNEDASEVTMTCLMEKTPQQLAEPCVRFLVLALGILFMGQQDKADTLIEATKALPPVISRYAQVVIISCAYAASGNVVTVQQLFTIVSARDEDEDEKKKAGAEGATSPTAADAAPAAAATSGAAAGEDSPADASAAASGAAAATAGAFNHKAAAVMGIGAIAMGEDLGQTMAKRAVLHALLSKEDAKTSGRRGVPLALALLCVSDPQMPVVENLNKLSHDTDPATAQAAALAIGIVSAGSNNARVATALRQLTGYYSKDTQHNHVFVVRLAQALLSMGKGHISLSPKYSDGLCASPVALAGIMTLCTCALDLPNTLLDKYHYMFYSVALAANPRMLLTVNANLEPLQTQVRVGQAVDTVTLPGKPKTITGFQTHQTPVLLSRGERAELVPGKYKAVGAVFEGVAIVLEKAPQEQAAE
jgi:26S proteasome regulatory subunit N1